MPIAAGEVEFEEAPMKHDGGRSADRWLVPPMALLMVVAWVAVAADAPAPEPELQKRIDEGAALYAERCASCHDHPRERIPPREALRYRSPEAVHRALTRGAMQHVAGSLDAEEAGSLAAFLTGSLPGSLPQPLPNRCAGEPPPVEARAGDWPFIGRDLENTRHAPRPGWRAEETPRLALKWAFAYPDGASGPPIVVGGRVFLASGTGEVFSLDARTGCSWWSHATERLVRAVTFGTTSGDTPAVFFGDHKGFVTALDARTGALVWTTRVEEHVLAKITAPPSFYEGRLYVPLSSIEDPLQHEPGYACCTFRGSVVALDAATGRLLWKSYTIPEEPKPLAGATPDGAKPLAGATPDAAKPLAGAAPDGAKPLAGATPGGPTRYGPAGAAIWNPLTIDRKRGLVYAATGGVLRRRQPRGRARDRRLGPRHGEEALAAAVQARARCARLPRERR